METIEGIHAFMKDGCLICAIGLLRDVRSSYICSLTLDWGSEGPANSKDLGNFLEGVYWSQFRKVSRHLDL